MGSQGADDRQTLDLLARAREGEAEAFDRLLLRAAPRAMLFVRLRLGPALRRSVDEEDVLQEGYLAALESLDRFRYSGRGSFSRWLCTILENRIRALADHHGAMKRRPPGTLRRLSRLLEAARAEQTGPATSADRRSRDARIAEALESLSEEDREVLVLRYFRDATVDAIAHETGRSASAVRRAIGRATARLGALLGRGDAP